MLYSSDDPASASPYYSVLHERGEKDELSRCGGRGHHHPRGRTVPLAAFLAALACCFVFLLAACILLAFHDHGADPASSPSPANAVAAAAAVGYFQSYAAHDALPVVPHHDLVNATELDLKTGFRSAAAADSESPAVRSYVFNISHALASPDGFQKPMILVNGQSPGPLIEANVGDTIRVRVNNELRDASTAIHWHGIRQRNSSWMDGVEGVSQCGIPPGRSFTYEFRVEDQRGTYWYHSHLSVQYADGLYGPIVIHDPAEMVPPADDEKIVFLGDLYHTYAGDLRASYLQPTSRWSPHMSGVEPLADNLIMNGQNECDCSVVSTTFPPPQLPASSSSSSSFSSSSSSSSPPPQHVCTRGSLYTTSVRPGHRVRLRLINHSSFLSYWFSVDSHRLLIVEMDGVEIEPIAATGVYLNVGQRYSVMLEADQRPGRYRMRAALVKSCFLPYAGYNSSGLESSRFRVDGILAYEGAAASGPGNNTTGIGWAETNVSGAGTNPFGSGAGAGRVREGCNDMPFDAARPRRRLGAYDVAEENKRYVEFEFRQAQDVNRVFVNKTAWAPLPDNATIWKLAEQDFSSPDRAGSYSSWDFGLNQQVLLFPAAEAGAQLVINSRDNMEHPWHMHGHTFQVVGWGPGLFGGGAGNGSGSGGGDDGTTWNLGNPMRRDTVTVPANSHLVLRFFTDNPGMWAVHCHVAWHMEGGMFLTMAERPSDLVAMLAGLDRSVTRLGGEFCAWKRDHGRVGEGEGSEEEEAEEGEEGVNDLHSPVEDSGA